MAGDMNVDLVLSGCPRIPAAGQETLAQAFAMALGGGAANSAAGLARLGRSVLFLGAVGSDLWGDFCVERLARAGVDCSRVLRDPQRPTGVTVSLSSPTDRAFVTCPGAIASLQEDAFSADLFGGLEHLHVSSYYLLSGLAPSCPSLFRRARASGLTTSLDPGFDPSEAWSDDIRGALEECDLFFPNAVELQELTRQKDLHSSLRDLENGRTRTVVKLGSRGAATLEGGRLLEMPAYPVDAHDTTGAGDSFDAGFLHAWLSGWPIKTCLAWGTAAGSLAARGAGGSSSQGDPAEIERLVASTLR